MYDSFISVESIVLEIVLHVYSGMSFLLFVCKYMPANIKIYNLRPCMHLPAGNSTAVEIMVGALGQLTTKEEKPVPSVYD